MSRTEALNVVVAVCTFRRPDGLARLYRALGEIEQPELTTVNLVTVDNAGDVDLPAPGERWPSVVETEHERGIPFARNRAVSIARSLDADAVVFFDDDEVPERDCLVRLVEVWRSSHASVVQGSSRPVFDSTPPDWVVDGGYFERSLPSDGTEIAPYRARTSNVLVAIDVFETADPPFDTRLRLTGGSDSFLFRSAGANGHTFVAAGSAMVEEAVPASRTTPRWLARRQYRIGWGRSYHLRSTELTPQRLVRRIGAGVFHALTAPMAAWDVHKRGDASMFSTLAAVEVLRRAAYGAGLMGGMIGRKPAEYSEVHGS